MKLTITIQMDNAAFEGQTEYETARILHQLANEVIRFGVPTNKTLLDANGNTTGRVRLES